MSTYSDFFSSGLLAPYQGIAGSPAPPSSPVPLPSSPVDPIDRSMNLTPTPSSSVFPSSYDSNATSMSNGIFTINTNSAVGTERPRLRKRRSSLTVGAGPMAHIKSPSRSATSAFQRTGILSPSRSRSGSLNEGGDGMGYSIGVANEGSSLVGRLRSGSLSFGGALRSRRVLRKATPAAPPPTAPLPELPAVSTSGNMQPIRRPLAHRFYSVDNYTPSTLPSPSLLSPDFASKLAMAMNTPPSLSPMDRPVDSAYFTRVNESDEVMKEN
ncbi:hypothetical protein SERLA73DRAFT_185333 [Serpula lacrymans var. lacrymans S7.3]|uniref:Uncharacterized protein n=2 Tax=Serpula lacrymans var. lacrymans TaxID=341189 RepID=F8Q4I5_SERL3|nr:uncharacterized protein SERLADRAFT_473724 [Serpula lacrymans var. lacrymans S7.9]EGN97040.1 hypothetical protein SERLA73DRAFT_185333 [Serpula lacrymans var. lacrymans S7.3]EGO22625.1 hypothetical protein SERLADRAFT_473724 [Serpula lacrymans var. lacrymans S7.9]